MNTPAIIATVVFSIIGLWFFSSIARTVSRRHR